MRKLLLICLLLILSCQTIPKQVESNSKADIIKALIANNKFTKAELVAADYAFKTKSVIIIGDENLKLVSSPYITEKNGNCECQFIRTIILKKLIVVHDNITKFCETKNFI